ncbi:uncharacterized protein LOC129602457 isoform X2 [Paramacrobiotus metropolitanus]|uniref:uncharacterized protein LOC129602457 isoform X2 n=1 Tax=Paramacrobiotus metropolitanus TaxID=2943436 RepID=UPI00244649AC|nr:uncharacterized protein LOC129602457 isoform X2 [Paramacrobiotus metropolitanus]
MTVTWLRGCKAIMGKRKQECPRKHSGASPKHETTEDASKLEHVVKKLKSKNDSAEISPNDTGSRDLPDVSRHAHINGSPLRAKITPNVLFPGLTQTEPLDLRTSQSHSAFVVKNIASVSRDGQIAQKKGDPEFTALDLSRSTHHGHPMSTASPPLPATFQQLSAKLEEYFATGIVASKFPKKMVRGQDIWMQDIEQKRAILKCLKCGASYNSLTELAKHIKKSGHHDDVGRPVEKLTSPEPTAIVPLPCRRSSPSDQPHPKHTKPVHVKSVEYKPDITSPSAFKPLRTDQRIKTFQPKKFEQSLPVGHADPGSGRRGRILKYSQKFDVGRSPVITSHRRSHPLTPECSVPSSDKSDSSKDVTTDRKVNSTKYSIRNAHLERTEESTVLSSSSSGSSSMNPAESKYPMPTPVLGLSNTVNPLFALKKFLDIGIPRLKPTGIDGGRI